MATKPLDPRLRGGVVVMRATEGTSQILVSAALKKQRQIARNYSMYRRK